MGSPKAKVVSSKPKMREVKIEFHLRLSRIKIDQNNIQLCQITVVINTLTIRLQVSTYLNVKIPKGQYLILLISDPLIDTVFKIENNPKV